MQRKKVIIAGAGFGGIQLAQSLPEKEFEVLIIDKINHHQFQPLFYQVATSQIEPSSISFPIRYIFKGSRQVAVRLAEVQEIRAEQKKVVTSIGEFSYDYLVIAIGCKTNFFGNAETEKNCFTLKSTAEAIAIRNHIIETFEKIISAPEQEQEALLSLVIVGAGPTGVELAGAFAEIKRNVLPRDYPGIDFSHFTITLVEGSANTLNNMSERSKQDSQHYLKEMGVEILTQTFVKNYDGEKLALGNGKTINTKTVIWAAGVLANGIKGIPAESVGPGGRIKVNRLNEVQSLKEVYAIGDVCLMQTPLYPKGHPQVANVAINQAKNLARNLVKKLSQQSLTEYEYKDLGSMATIGTNKAVVDFKKLHLKGYLAWLIWMFLHLMLILSVRNKLIIFINWAWTYLTKNSSLRLIIKAGK